MATAQAQRFLTPGDVAQRFGCQAWRVSRLLDRMPDPGMAGKIRATIESEGDKVTDLHLWRLGPGHLGAIVSVATSQPREATHYRQQLAHFADLSHVTVEVQHLP